MQGKEFLYFLTDSENRSFKVVNGLVTLSSTPAPLEFTPGDWENIVVENARNPTYFALDRSFSIPLKAVEDGALILKDQFYNYGSEVIVNLVILRQELFYDGTEYGFYYRSMYKGEVDFSNFDHTGPIVTLTLMEGGLVKQIKAKENLVYEIPLDHPNAHSVYMDGIKLKEAARFSFLEYPLEKAFSGDWFTAPMVNTGTDSSQTPGISFFSPSVEEIPNFAWYKDGLNYLASADPLNVGPVTVNITGQIIYTVNRNDPNNGVRLRFYTSNQSSSFQNQYLLTDITPAGGSTVGVTYTVNVNVAVPLAPDEKLFFDVQFIGGSGNVTITFSDASKLEMKYDFIFRPTYVQCLTLGTIFRELISKISDGTHTPKSDLLTFWDNIKVTCGDAIRGFPTAVIKTSLSDFFQSVDAQFDVGMGMINGVLRLEAKSFFIDFDNPIDLGEVRDLSVRPAKEHMYSSILVGYADQTYDNVNGKQEFNSRMQFSFPNTRITKELNKMSVYRADSYGIEFIRINLEGKTTTDSASDNDVFLIHTEKEPSNTGPLISAYRLDRTLNAGAGGMIETATPFNFFLSPKRMLERNGRHIHSFFYKQDDKWVKFQTADKNKEMTAGGIVEKGDVLIGNFPPGYFIPIEAEFEAPPPIDIIQLLDQSPVRAYTFRYLGIEFLAVGVSAPIKPANNEPSKFLMLFAPQNDLTQLIPIFD